MRILENIIRKTLLEIYSEPMRLVEDVKVSENLTYHLENKISLSENIFRIYSDEYFNLINEVRKLYNRGLSELNEEDQWIVESDFGKSILL
jgi:hypothetical protein